MCGLDVICQLNKHPHFARWPLKLLDQVDFSGYDSASRRVAISRRGPDFNDRFIAISSDFRLDMFGSVLRIQGDEVCNQPLISETTGSSLVWNGEFLNHPVSKESDTSLILNMLDVADDVVSVLNEVQGPFAFVYFDKAKDNLWFGKDKQGRRSLLYAADAEGTEIVISSACLLGGVEVPAGDGIFKISLKSGEMSFHEWEKPIPYLAETFLSLSNPCNPSIQSLRNRLRESIERHISTTSVRSPLGILYSGGLDSALIAGLVSEVLVNRPYNVSHIDLINVAAAGTSSPDRSTGLIGYSELLSKFPGSLFRFICVDMDQGEVKQFESHIMDLAFPKNTHMDFNISCALWFGGRAKGRILSADYVNDPKWKLLAKQIIESESLANAEENRRPKFDTSGVSMVCSSCGCRKTKPGCAISACRICCLKQKEGCPAHTPYVDPRSKEPKITVEDFLTPYLGEQVTSDCRVLFVGHGADELFGGYGRHETRSKQLGLVGLREEMLLDLTRLWTRNLGRDDRVLGDSGRDTRHAFLDESIVEWVGEWSAEVMLGKNGENKPLLRQLARDLGLEHASKFRKRAIQFGTRIAQQTNIAVYGSHSKGSGTDRYKT
jgi:asparagine synthetase B (glutamine-hydrolysing)